MAIEAVIEPRHKRARDKQRDAAVVQPANMENILSQNWGVFSLPLGVGRQEGNLRLF